MTAMDAKQSTDLELQKITDILQDTELDNLRLKLLGSFDQFETSFNHLKEKVKKQISEEERPYVQDSYRIYETIRNDKYKWFNMKLPESRPNYLKEQYEIRDNAIQQYVDYMLSNRLDISKPGRETIANRLARYSGWTTTTMIIHPGSEDWIQYMVQNDPIYLIDESYELLKPSMSGFHEVYQNRLRPYIIHEDQDQDLLWQLPNNQFGLVLSWNYFNHRPFDVIRRYLIELYKKMCPGGMLLMTYNDCDRWKGVLAVETGQALYTPGSLIIDFAESLGFELIFKWNEGGPWTWIEFRKPGKQHSIRGGQPMARILPKPVA
jgi:hypothetical protein